MFVLFSLESPQYNAEVITGSLVTNETSFYNIRPDFVEKHYYETSLY